MGIFRNSAGRAHMQGRAHANHSSFLLAGLFSLLWAFPVAAQTLTFGPILGRGHTPDQMIIRWGTGSEADATTVAYRQKGDSIWLLRRGTTARAHEIILTGLSAGTSYDYEIRSLAGTPVGATFSTCPVPGHSMAFVFYGDSRDGPGSHARIVAQIITKAPEMVFEGGDITHDGSYNQYLTEFFPIVAELAKTTPFMAVPGNHDAHSSLGLDFGRIFPAPRAIGAPWRPYYSFPCGNALFIGLDTNGITNAAQLQFLNEQLRAARDQPTIDHVFVWLHHAPYSVGNHGDNSTIQHKLVPLLNEPGNKVTAVFAGHDHLYARMDDGSGVFYIVSAGAGARLHPPAMSSKASTRSARAVHNFVYVRIAGLTMRAIAYDDSGVELDRFGVTKSAKRGMDGGQRLGVGAEQVPN